MQMEPQCCGEVQLATNFEPRGKLAGNTWGNRVLIISIVIKSAVDLINRPNAWNSSRWSAFEMVACSGHAIPGDSGCCGRAWREMCKGRTNRNPMKRIFRK
jgi:hypothetical protein